MITAVSCTRLVILAFAGLALAMPAAAMEWQTQSVTGFGFTGQSAKAPANEVSAKLFAAPSLPQSWSAGTPAFGAPAFGTSPFFGFQGGSVARSAERINDTWLLGIESSQSSFSTLGTRLSGAGFAGLDVQSNTVRLGYDLGQLTPYVSATGTNVRPVGGLGQTQFEQGILAQNPRFNGQAAASVGAGFNYNVNPNLQIGVGVTVGSGPGLLGQ